MLCDSRAVYSNSFLWFLRHWEVKLSSAWWFIPRFEAFREYQKVIGYEGINLNSKAYLDGLYLYNM